MMTMAVLMPLPLYKGLAGSSACNKKQTVCLHAVKPYGSKTGQARDDDRCTLLHDARPCPFPVSDATNLMLTLAPLITL